MELEQLRQLHAISKHGTLTKAAEVLHISQPALSRSIQRLESELGIELFARLGNRIALNEAGNLAIEHAEGILRAERHMKDALADFDKRRRTLRIGTCAPAPLWRLVPLIVEQFPNLVINPETLDEKHLEQRLFDGTIDVAVLPKPFPLPNVVSTPFMTENLYLSAPSDHPLATRTSVTLQELDGETFLLYAGIGFWRSICERQMPNANFVTQDNYVVFGQLAQSTPLLTFATDVADLQQGAEGRVAIPIDDTDVQVTFYLVSPTSATKRWGGLLSWLRAHV